MRYSTGRRANNGGTGKSGGCQTGQSTKYICLWPSHLANYDPARAMVLARPRCPGIIMHYSPTARDIYGWLNGRDDERDPGVYNLLSRVQN